MAANGLMTQAHAQQGQLTMESVDDRFQNRVFLGTSWSGGKHQTCERIALKLLETDIVISEKNDFMICANGLPDVVQKHVTERIVVVNKRNHGSGVNFTQQPLNEIFQVADDVFEKRNPVTNLLINPGRNRFQYRNEDRLSGPCRGIQLKAPRKPDK